MFVQIPSVDQPIEEGEMIQLREVVEDDLPIFFAQQQDPEANQMAAFTAKDPSDRDAFMAHWAKILANETALNKTILFEGQVAGNVAKFEFDGEPHVAYWLGKEYWGKGIATAALGELLQRVSTRPLYARAVKDNIGSIRVLQKCGFVIVGEDKGFANARGAEVEEFILKLE